MLYYVKTERSIYGFPKLDVVVSPAYGYNKNGAMKFDWNSGISLIQYNWFNLPEQVTFRKGHVHYYNYDTMGEKRQVRHITVRNELSIAMGTGTMHPGTMGNILTELVTDYFVGGSILYEDNQLKMVRTEEGYLTRTNGVYTHYLYVKDHLGNNRTVIRAVAGSTTGSWNQVQEMSYYPFGMPYPQANNSPELQPFKFGDKELDEIHGLNWYTQGARPFGAILPITPTPDPLAEDFYNTSLYAQWGLNPVRYIDPTGKSPVLIAIGAVAIFSYLINAQSNTPEGEKKGNPRNWEWNPINWDNVFFMNVNANTGGNLTVSGGLGSPNFPTLQVGYNTHYGYGVGIGTNGHSSGFGADFYAGTGMTALSEVFYSKDLGTWMGKNGKFYNQSWGGNQYTGGKYKFAKNWAKPFNIASKALGAYSMYNSVVKGFEGEISPEEATGDVVFGGAAMYSGFLGGWANVWYSLGKEYGPMTRYLRKQEEKRRYKSVLFDY